MEEEGIKGQGTRISPLAATSDTTLGSKLAISSASTHPVKFRRLKSWKFPSLGMYDMKALPTVSIKAMLRTRLIRLQLQCTTRIVASEAEDESKDSERKVTSRQDLTQEFSPSDVSSSPYSILDPADLPIPNPFLRNHIRFIEFPPESREGSKGRADSEYTFITSSPFDNASYFLLWASHQLHQETLLSICLTPRHRCRRSLSIPQPSAFLRHLPTMEWSTFLPRPYDGESHDHRAIFSCSHPPSHPPNLLAPLARNQNSSNGPSLRPKFRPKDLIPTLLKQHLYTDTEEEAVDFFEKHGIRFEGNGGASTTPEYTDARSLRIFEQYTVCLPHWYRRIERSSFDFEAAAMFHPPESELASSLEDAELLF
ncbi:hypothetical protein F5Y06DRAFT_294082 [Hypoxylon sp. FL0890]|nr:hypothetical protein F5Y06DRAFT_294082 [Hypoxylon sp. FL0890]